MTQVLKKLHQSKVVAVAAEDKAAVETESQILVEEINLNEVLKLDDK